METFLCGLGLAFILEGIPYFLSPQGMKNFAQRIPQMEDNSIRLWGLAAMLLGISIIYLGRQ